jgi:hypothetical protein
MLPPQSSQPARLYVRKKDWVTCAGRRHEKGLSDSRTAPCVLPYMTLTRRTHVPRRDCGVDGIEFGRMLTRFPRWL